MLFRRRNAWLVAALGPLLAHCAPDFDALSSGHAAGQGGAPSDGGSTGSTAGTDVGGTSNASGTSTGGVSGQPASSGSGGMPQTSGSGGNLGPGGGTTTGSGGDGGAMDLAGAAGLAGEGGGGPAPTCVTPHAGQLGYDDFDKGLASPIFPYLVTSGSTDTTHGATCKVEFDPSVGKTCPGSFHVIAAFKAYASGSQADEHAYGGYDFSFADWSLAKAMHVMIKVSPTSAPLASVQLYLQSGDNYAYDSVYDSLKFKSGTWYEIVFPLPGSKLDATKVRRMGIELTLARDGTANIPPTPPTVDVWFDDVWLEAR